MLWRDRPINVFCARCSNSSEEYDCSKNGAHDFLIANLDASLLRYWENEEAQP